MRAMKGLGTFRQNRGDTTISTSVSTDTPTADEPYGHVTANRTDSSKGHFEAQVSYDIKDLTLEGSYRNVFRRNIIAQSDIAVVMYDSEGGHRFEQNSCVANFSPLYLVGKRTDTIFRGNYWSDNDEPDLDGDGYSDRPYRLSSVFDHLRGNLMAADLFAQGFAATALGVAERAFPVLDPIPVVDDRPLARPPALPDVPMDDPGERRAGPWGLAASAASLAAGLVLFATGRRRRA